MLGEVAAEMDALARIERDTTAAAWRAERAALQAADALLARYSAAVEQLSRAAPRCGRLAITGTIGVNGGEGGRK